MARIVKVQVTAEDIKAGKRHKPNCCAVALAVQRATGHEAAVGHETINVHGYKQVESPRVVKRFIADFDGNVFKPGPIEFEIEIVAVPDPPPPTVLDDFTGG